MSKNPSYEQLEQLVKKWKKEALEGKRVEEALRETEQRYRDLYENAPIAYFSISSVDGSILRCNFAALRLLGYERETMMRMKVFDLYAKTSHGVTKAKRAFKRFRKGESIRNIELQMKRQDGQTVWVSLSVEPMGSHDGEIVESRSMVLDISKRKQAEEALRKKTHDFGERVKELKCLYEIFRLREKPGVSLEEILQGVVNLLPASYQYPEVTCSRIVLEGKEYITKNLKDAPWKQSAGIIVHGETIGSVEVCYQEGKPESDEGPFLKEERSLINAVAEQLGKIVEHMRAEEALSWEADVDTAIVALSKALISPTSLEDISSLVLEYAKRLTASELGYVGYIEPETGYLVSPTLTRDVWESCQVPDKDIVFQKFAGLWGWVLEKREPLLTNRPSEDPRSNGTPRDMFLSTVFCLRLR